MNVDELAEVAREGRASRVARFSEAETPWAGLYVHDNKTYRSRGRWTRPEVNASHSLEDIHDYVRSLGRNGVKNPA